MKQNGFTLIELLTVVLIIGILTSIGIPQYRKAVARSQVVEAESMLRAIYDSSERLAAEFGYRSYEQLRSASQSQSDTSRYSFSRMDMFGGGSNMPTGCSLQQDNLEMNCQRFLYKISENGYATAKKKQRPYKDTIIMLNRSTMELFCDPAAGDSEGEACDVFGIDQFSGIGVTPGSIVPTTGDER